MDRPSNTISMLSKTQEKANLNKKLGNQSNGLISPIHSSSSPLEINRIEIGQKTKKLLFISC